MSATRDVLAGLVALVQGSTGATVCAVPSGTFRRVATPVEELPAGAAGRPTPFNLRGLRLITTGWESGATSGSRLMGTHELELVFAYSSRPHDDLELISDIADDETLLRRVLEYEPNIALTTGWTACRIVSSETRSGGEGDPAPLVLLVVGVEVDHREVRLS